MKSEIVVTDNELPADVLQAIAAGRKIEAIKLLREATGLGLANAKVLVDRASARHMEQNPAMLGPTEESNTGRLVAMLLLLVLSYLAYRYFFDA
jgi:hypothetical protein